MVIILFFSGFFIAIAVQVFFIEGYYNNRKLNPVFVSSLTVASSLIIIFLFSIIKQNFFEFDYKQGHIYSASEILSGPPKIFSYISACGYGMVISGLSVICFFLYSYYLINLDKEKRNITDINFGFKKGFEAIFNKNKID